MPAAQGLLQVSCLICEGVSRCAYRKTAAGKGPAAHREFQRLAGIASIASVIASDAQELPEAAWNCLTWSSRKGRQQPPQPALPEASDRQHRICACAVTGWYRVRECRDRIMTGVHRAVTADSGEIAGESRGEQEEQGRTQESSGSSGIFSPQRLRMRTRSPKDGRWCAKLREVFCP